METFPTRPRSQPSSPEVESQQQETWRLADFRRQFLHAEHISDNEFVLLDRNRQPISVEGRQATVRVRKEGEIIVFNVAGVEVPYISLMGAIRDVAPAAALVQSMPKMAQIPEGRATQAETEEPPLTLPQVRQEIRNLLGKLSDEEWNKAQDALADLRREIDHMQWFEMGPNSVGAEKEGERWNQLVLAPRDTEHRQQLVEILAELQIYPWPEVEHNVPVLVVENPRDIALLSEGLIFDYLASSSDPTMRQRLMNERIHLQRYERAERQRIIQMDLDKDEFRSRDREEQEQRVAILMNEIAQIIRGQPVFEPPPGLPSDKYYEFGYPRPGRIPQAGRASRQSTEPPSEERESSSLDIDVAKMEEDFRTGRINEDTLQDDLIQSEITRRPMATPDLALFPRKYEWVPSDRKGEPGTYRERNTGKILGDTEIERLIEQAKSEDSKEQYTATKELTLIYRQLILYSIRSIREVFPSADPDELFQAALIGLKWTIDHYEKRPEGNFRHYLMPSMEGYMRRAVSGTYYPVHLPTNVSSERRRIREAERSLRAQHPDQSVEPENVESVLRDQNILKTSSPEEYDRLLRRVLWNFEKVEPALLDQENIADHDVSMTGQSLVAEPIQLTDAERGELRQHMSRMLGTLPPRQERILRRYFEFDLRQGQQPTRVYEQLSSEFNMGTDEVKRRLRDLTGEGDLSDSKTLDKLSAADRSFAEKYLEHLKAMDDATFESISQELGVGRERVRQVMAQAFRRMRHPTRRSLLQQHLRP